jgi:cytochrome c oxidase subunit I+III
VAVDVTTPEASERVERLETIWREPPRLIAWATTVDHKTIALRYFWTALSFFGAAGVEALLMRTQLARPEQRVLSPEQFNELFTMHGVTMIFLFVTPMLTGAFGNYLVPLMIGARDMAFPRMNALSYWLYLGAGLFIYTGLFIGDAPNAGWFNYVPLAEKPYNPGPNIDFYNLGLIFLTISSTVGATNFIVTIFKLRAPGMSLNRLPIFCWAILATAFSLVFALPALTAANVFLELERFLGFHFFDEAHGGDPLLWQHLFWIFGHPDVYIIVLPALGIVSAILPTFARRPLVAPTWVALATMMTAFIGFGVWVHHMFATGLPQITMIYFAAASVVIVVPSGIQIFAWCATLLRGRPDLKTPLLYVLGFLVTFVIGGLSGLMFPAIPFDQQVTDSYFVVAHFHYVLFGGAVFPMFAGFHYWYPKVTGRMYSEPLAQAAFWIFFVGFNLLFFPMHIAGLLGMPRRVYTYHGGLGWDAYNLASTIGAFVLAGGILLVIVNLARSRFRGAPAGADPWGGDTLEWATSSPPPAFNFPVIPTVRSLSPNWDLADRREDDRRLRTGALVLDTGHETPATSELDAQFEDVLEMPSNSPWPLALAVSLALVFTLLLVHHYTFAGLCGGLALLVLAAWHSQEPEES